MYDFHFCTYVSNSRVCVHVFEEGMPYANLSTNVEDVVLEDNEFVLNHDLISPLFHQFIGEMLTSGHFEDTGKRVNYGYCRNVPVWRVK